jgi:hypothetical protein
MSLHVAAQTLEPWKKGNPDIHFITTGRGDCAFMIMPDGTTSGHIVIRVKPGGESYNVFVLDSFKKGQQMKHVFGPYAAAGKNNNQTLDFKRLNVSWEILR